MLATCLMAESQAGHVLNGGVSRGRDTLSSCRTGYEQHTSFVRSAHGVTMTSYHRSSLTMTATNVARGWQTSSRTSTSMHLLPGRGVLRSPDRSGCMTHHGAAIDQRKSEAPERASGTDAILGRSSGHGPGVRARQFMTQSSVWVIHIMS